ncbi:MAG TPA: SPOR domain-containing protein [Candidatus Acidoferrales bacterium]|nr:SPOR domain-containing protein [Candidatus Acidoferrales bacterium]
MVGLFLGVVLLCGVFFTLGYVMGRTQYGGAVHAADGFNGNLPSAPVLPKSKAAPAAKNAPAPAPDNGGWDFYDNKKSASDHLEPSPAPAASPASAAKAPASVPAAATKSTNAPRPASTKTVAATPKQPPARFQAPAMNKNSIVLQVAAVKLQRDALEMADAIQQKKFPAFVATSPADNFLHVQVGPYPDMAAAENAKRALEQLGFKPIIKH